MVGAAYVPDAGDIVWLSFTLQAGHEQSGTRPGVVLSPRIYNERAGLCLACPVTSQVKGYPFEVPLPEELPVNGVVLADHVRSLDWRARGAEFIAAAPETVRTEVYSRLLLLIGG